MNIEVGKEYRNIKTNRVLTVIGISIENSVMLLNESLYGELDKQYQETGIENLDFGMNYLLCTEQIPLVIFKNTFILNTPLVESLYGK